MTEFEYYLEIKLDDDFPEDLKEYYKEYNCNGEDSGVDLVIPNDVLCNTDSVNTINHKISCQLCLYKNGEFIKYMPYWLLPRSSISKTPYRMANSVGLIDKGYRGNIMAKVDLLNNPENKNFSRMTKKEISFSTINTITKGTRMFQIASGDLTPIDGIRIVSELSKTIRDDGGFGSTGK